MKYLLWLLKLIGRLLFAILAFIWIFCAAMVAAQILNIPVSPSLDIKADAGFLNIIVFGAFCLSLWALITVSFCKGFNRRESPIFIWTVRIIFWISLSSWIFGAALITADRLGVVLAKWLTPDASFGPINILTVSAGAFALWGTMGLLLLSAHINNKKTGFINRVLADRSQSEEVYQSGERVKVIGPIIGNISNGVRIIIALPSRTYASKIACEIYFVNAVSNGMVQKRGDRVARTEFRAPESSVYQQFYFDFYKKDHPKLKDGSFYCYQFVQENEEVIDLDGGLCPEHCYFLYKDTFAEHDSFLLMSCHNPFEEKKGSAVGGWAMWDDLLVRLNEDSSIRFMALGGDQVYNDDVENFAFKDGYLKEGILGMLPNRLIAQYQIFWGHLNYRRCLARVPTLAIWDDHDITDGWGGRPESYVPGRSKFKDDWLTYLNAASAIFKAYQACRNPEILEGAPDSVFTTKFDFGENRIYLLDLRSERNAKTKTLMSALHEKALMDSLDKLPDDIKRVFVLSPVVPFRTNMGQDERLEWWSKALFFAASNIEQRKYLKVPLSLGWVVLFLLSFGSMCCIVLNWGFIFSTVCLLALGIFLSIINGVINLPELPNLSDDLSDSLSSKANLKTLRRILNKLFMLKKRWKSVAILSGDIHLAGMSEVILIENGNTYSMPQVVSSPISYQPMPKAAEGFTTTTSEMVVSEKDEGSDALFARNIFYVSKRNFAQIFPGRMEDRLPSIYFYLEGHRVPIAMTNSFMPSE